METREGKDDLRPGRTGEHLCLRKKKKSNIDITHAVLLESENSGIFGGGGKSKPKASRTNVGSTN